MNAASFLTVYPFFAYTAVGHSEAITLVEDGFPTSIIVVADDATAAAQQGAEDLQMWLRRMSGATVPIKSESETQETTEESLVLVGDTRRTRGLGINPDQLDLEEIIIRTFPGVLVIIGDDERPDGFGLTGTLFAVDAFAKEILGVRLLWPGELGEMVPQRPTIRVSDLNIREKPILVDRQMVNLGYSGAIHTKLDALGWDRERYQKFQAASHEWFRFHRFGGSYNGSFGHAFGDYWDRFHQEHPDWFALQPDGTRDNSQPEHALYPSHRLCVSNRGLIEQVAADCIKQLKRNPALDAVSVSPNDGGPQTFCLCDSCESWDAPEGENVQMRSKEGPISHVSLTDRFVRFYSAVAEIVADELPDRYIGAYAYSLYTLAPIRAKLHPNVVIGFVPGMRVYVNEDEREKMRGNWLKWSKVVQRLFLRPNWLTALDALPSVYVHRLGEDMRFYADNGMSFARFDCNCHHWATNGLNYYVLARLLWDPYRDVDEIIEDYCTVGFGTAGEAIRRYFEVIERMTTAIAEERQRPTPGTIACHYTDQALATLHEILDEAERAAGCDVLVSQRVAFLRRGLEYAPICRDYLVAKAAIEDGGDKWLWRTYMEESVRRTTWFQKLGPSWVIHAPWLIYWNK